MHATTFRLHALVHISLKVYINSKIITIYQYIRFEYHNMTIRKYIRLAPSCKHQCSAHIFSQLTRQLANQSRAYSTTARAHTLMYIHTHTHTYIHIYTHTGIHIAPCGLIH